MKILPVVAAVISLFTTTTSLASAAADAASTCLTDSTSGKDRKIFVKWVFISMSKHPDIRAMSSVTPEVEEDTNRLVGALVTRLMTDDCGTELRAMVKEDGGGSIAKAFETFGRVAMTELMTDKNVGAAMSQLDRYTDNEKVRSANHDK